MKEGKGGKKKIKGQGWCGSTKVWDLFEQRPLLVRGARVEVHRAKVVHGEHAVAVGVDLAEERLQSQTESKRGWG